ncbi:hypothetical protein F4810DRAFT_650212 [Camillea tinctor]|nr:hypothetical protein F4810DRAFT_650212 [Camillea tinctor]
MMVGCRRLGTSVPSPSQPHTTVGRGSPLSPVHYLAIKYLSVFLYVLLSLSLFANQPYRDDVFWCNILCGYIILVMYLAL